MMLSRAADNLYWMARYMERAENMARLLEANGQSDMLPAGNRSGPSRLSEWEAPLYMTGTVADFMERYEEVSAGRVVAYMLLDRHNATSIRCCLEQARESGRATRHLLTDDLWEGLNQTWLGMADLTYAQVAQEGVPERLEWVRHRSDLFRGSLHGTMRRGEGFMFACLGAAVERVDNTARLLRVKADTFAQADLARGFRHANDYFRAAVLLNSLSAFKAYREIYSANLEFPKIATLVIQRPDVPRSLACGALEIVELLSSLRPDAGALGPARDLVYRLQAVQIADLLRVGLRGFLDDVTARVGAVADQIRTDFLMAP